MGASPRPSGWPGHTIKGQGATNARGNNRGHGPRRATHASRSRHGWSRHGWSRLGWSRRRRRGRPRREPRPRRRAKRRALIERRPARLALQRRPADVPAAISEPSRNVASRISGSVPERARPERRGHVACRAVERCRRDAGVDGGLAHDRQEVGRPHEPSGPRGELSASETPHGHARETPASGTPPRGTVGPAGSRIRGEQRDVSGHRGDGRHDRPHHVDRHERPVLGRRSH